MCEKDQIELLFQFDKMVHIIVIEVDASPKNISLLHIYVSI